MGLRRKKILQAPKRDTEANRKRREEFLQTIQVIALEKPNFLDESGKYSPLGVKPTRRK
jgi:hypothetical protein